ncbi:MAG TPA: LemA family protein [Candidatus Babeliales bacterium]|nr:LemA family protein [Candidatus Babeliales bacterium]
MLLYILLATALIIFLWIFTTYNSFIKSKEHVNEGWSGIDVQLKRRSDLIPNLVAVVKQYATHEKDTLEKVTSMRASAMSAQSIEGRANAEAGLTQALKTLFAVAENYPDLKANQNFLSLQQDLGNIEQELQLARRYYNGTARNYNMLIQQFPSNIIASFSNFKVTPYFELASNEEREVPQIKF